MNDQRISELVRMAMEVDGLEAEANGPQLRLVGAGGEDDLSPVRRRRAWWMGTSAAAAAALALWFVVPAFQRGSAPITPIADGTGSSVSGVEKPVIVRNQRLTPDPVASPAIEYPPMVLNTAQERADPGSVERCIVVAIYRDDRGAMHCVKVKPHEWSENKCLNEISQQELRCVSVGQPCSASADHAMLVALSGPQRSLPKTEADAVRLAGCILGSPSENDSRGYANAAADCVPAGVSVKIETTSDSR
jgi:hypothetical protein